MSTDPHADARRAAALALVEPLHVALRDTDPMVRHHHSSRWEMTTEWYRKLRALQVVAGGGDDPTAEEMAEWVISPGDMIMGLPITEGQGDPRIVADMPPPTRLEDYVTVPRTEED